MSRFIQDLALASREWASFFIDQIVAASSAAETLPRDTILSSLAARREMYTGDGVVITAASTQEVVVITPSIATSQLPSSSSAAGSVQTDTKTRQRLGTDFMLVWNAVPGDNLPQVYVQYPLYEIL